jgi:hypothetical protein
MSLCRNVRERRGCAGEAAKSGCWIEEASDVTTLFEPKSSPVSLSLPYIESLVDLIHCTRSLQTLLKLIDPSDEIDFSKKKIPKIIPIPDTRSNPKLSSDKHDALLVLPNLPLPHSLPLPP